MVLFERGLAKKFFINDSPLIQEKYYLSEPRVEYTE